MADSSNSLDLTPPELEEITASVMELCHDYRKGLSGQPVWRPQDRQRLDRALEETLPENPGSWPEIFRLLREEIFFSQGHLAHPRFFAFVPSPNNFVSCLADFLVSVHNPFAGNWLEGSGAQTVERVVLGWLSRELGYPKTAGGLFLSGGSISNLAALAAAREWRFGSEDWRFGTVYLSDQTHSSVKRALRILGFADGQVRVIPSDSDFRISLDELKRSIAADRKAGHVPFCVVANAGSTNTGAVDPFDELAACCAENQIWLHADGAFGGAAAFCEEGKAALRGIHLADSITLDPHKWLFQPFACSCLLAREPERLRAAFHTSASYLQDAEGEWNLFDYGPELTRPFRALKLWLSLKVFGAAAFREAIARSFTLARAAEQEIRRLDHWQILSPAQMAVVTFRYSPPDRPPELVDRLNLAVAEKSHVAGFTFVASTRVRGQAALRFCTVNPRTTPADIADTVSHLDRLVREIAG
jgi:aromatic-L-amino-acid/L-tryptophan decarboxylase